MEFKLKIDHKIAVALRRIIMQNVPHYAYENVIINKNTTLLDNDHIKKRIMNIPVENLFLKIDSLKKIDKDILIFNKINDFKDINELKIVCSKKYDKSNNVLIQSVTTNDFTFFLNNKKISNPYKSEIKIVDLKYENDILDFTAFTKLNMPLKSIIYSITETPILLPNSKLILSPKSDKINSKFILQNAIYILKLKIENLFTKLKEIDYKNGKIIIENDILTFNYLVTYYLNELEDIEFASSNIDNLIERNGYINFVLKENSKKKIYDLLKVIEKNIFKQLDNIKV